MFQVFSDSGAITVKVLENLDLEAVPRLENVIDTTIGNDGRLLRVSLLDCSYLDSAAISLFIRLSKKRGATFEIHVPPTGGVHKAFEVCGLLSQRYVRVISEGLGSAS